MRYVLIFLLLFSVLGCMILGSELNNKEQEYKSLQMLWREYAKELSTAKFQRDSLEEQLDIMKRNNFFDTLHKRYFDSTFDGRPIKNPTAHSHRKLIYN